MCNQDLEIQKKLSRFTMSMKTQKENKETRKNCTKREQKEQISEMKISVTC